MRSSCEKYVMDVAIYLRLGTIVIVHTVSHLQLSGFKGMPPRHALIDSKVFLVSADLNKENVSSEILQGI